MLRFFTFSALVGYVLAQSAQCKSTLTAVALQKDAAACLNTVGLIGILTTNATVSVVPAVDAWLEGLCGSPACSNATLSAVVANITTGCSEDLSSLGLTSDLTGTITNYVLEYYPTARQILCLQEGQDKCVTKTLKDLEGELGTLSLNNILTFDSQRLAAIDTKIFCTNCVKEAYNILLEDVPEWNTPDTKAEVNKICDASFTDGQTPNTVNSLLDSSKANSDQDAATGALSPALYWMSSVATLTGFLTLL